ncbi:MAG: DUF4349 domain-containing protein [Chloroflexota bacterium]
MSRQRLSIVALFAFVAALAIACSGAAAPAPRPVTGPTSGDQFYDADGNPGERDEPTDSDDGVNGAPAPQQLIIYTGSLTLEVADVDAAISQAAQLIAGMGGHVAASRSSNTDDGKAATISYRIPAERWADALAAVKGLASKVLDEQTGSEDVTAQVVDLDARLANLRVTETALQSIMDRATTITDVLKVQSELTQVRGDIESLTAERELLASRAALATLDVYYNLPAVAETRIASDKWDPGREVDTAVAALVRLGQGAVSLLIWLLIVIVPVLLPIALVIYAAVWLRRRWLRNHPPAPFYGAPPLE